MRWPLVIFSAMLLAQPALAQTNPKGKTTFKKCVDDQGVTQYYDKTPPPGCKDKEITEMSDKGVVKKTIDAPPTEEQKKARADEAARKQDDARKAEEQTRHDTALLATYSNEREIDLARERNLQANEAILKNSELRLKTAQGKLDQNRRQAEGLAKQGKPVPDWLRVDLANNETEVKRLQEEFSARQKDQEHIRARFEADKQRYRELRTQQDAIQQKAAPRN
jgi:hypothetical protein